MSFSHSMHANIPLRKDVTEAQVIEALHPVLISILGEEGAAAVNSISDIHDLYGIQVEMGDDLYIYTSGDVSYSYPESVRQMAKNFNALCSEPAVVYLGDYDNADLFSAVTEYIIAETPEDAREFKFEQIKSEFLNKVSEFGFINDKDVEVLNHMLIEMRAEHKKHEGKENSEPLPVPSPS